MNRRVDHVFQSSSMGLLNPLRQIKSAIPDGLSQNVTEILPRLKDGGAYVKFNAPMDPKKIEGEFDFNDGAWMADSNCDRLTTPQRHSRTTSGRSPCVHGSTLSGLSKPALSAELPG